MDAPPEALTKEKSNYARLCVLLVDIGTQCLRDRFNKIHPPESLCSTLATHHAKLLQLWKKRIINQDQWATLFPLASSSASSEDFDITILMILLRNICGLSPPVTGWDTLPFQADKSVEADIARVKHYRNTIFAHTKTASIDDATYNTHWLAIRETLVRLGGRSYEATIDNLGAVCLDPQVEENYKGLLEQWKEDETDIKEKLEEVKKTLDDLKQEKGICPGLIQNHPDRFFDCVKVWRTSTLFAPPFWFLRNIALPGHYKLKDCLPGPVTE